MSGLLTVASGLPFEPTADGRSLNAPDNTQRSDLLVSRIQLPRHVGPGTYWFNPADFAGVTGAPGNDQRFGTSAFYETVGPGVFNVDSALFRDFKLTERLNLQFRAQALNVTNTPYFNNPNASCGTYHTPTGANRGYCSNATFGQIGPSQGTNNIARPIAARRAVSLWLRGAFR